MYCACCGLFYHWWASHLSAPHPFNPMFLLKNTADVQLFFVFQCDCHFWAAETDDIQMSKVKSKFRTGDLCYLQKLYSTYAYLGVAGRDVQCSSCPCVQLQVCKPTRAVYFMKVDNICHVKNIFYQGDDQRFFLITYPCNNRNKFCNIVHWRTGVTVIYFAIRHKYRVLLHFQLLVCVENNISHMWGPNIYKFEILICIIKVLRE